jgi:hypothetical protein
MLLTKRNVNTKRNPKRLKSQKRTKTNTDSAFDKWIAFREHMSESDIKQQMKLKSNAEYHKKDLPDYTARALFINQLQHAAITTTIDSSRIQS